MASRKVSVGKMSLMMEKINVYLDDIRPCPSGFILAKDVSILLELFKKNKVGILSLDHDLGVDIKNIPLSTGYDFVKIFCQNSLFCDEIYLHTDNVVGRENMYTTLIASQKRGFISSKIKIHRYPKV